VGCCIQKEQWLYKALDIRKERIDPRQSWQHYREAHFGIMRRLADYYLNKAPQLSEMKKAHRKCIRDDNPHIHFAHRERNDNRHSPKARIAWCTGAYSAYTNTGPHLLCDSVYPSPGSIRIYPLSSVANLSRIRGSETGSSGQLLHQPARSRLSIRRQSWLLSHDAMGGEQTPQRGKESAPHRDGHTARHNERCGRSDLMNGCFS
jgi:hypothetical protein